MKKTLFIIGLIAMLIFAPACLEEFFSTDEEEELNEDLPGVWYRFSIMRDGVHYGFPATVILNDNGTGTIKSIDEADQETANEDSFDWKTEGSSITITDENDSTIWSGTFVFNDDKSVVTFNFIEDGQSCSEVYVRYSGDEASEMIGNWVMVDALVDGEKPLSFQRIIFSEGGTAINYMVNDPEDSMKVEIEILNWKTCNGYLAVFNIENQLPPMVIEYTITDDVFSGTSYNRQGEEETYTFVRDVANIDQAGVGEWTMTSMKVDGWPTNDFQITLDLNDDGTGVWSIVYLSYYSDSYNFNWKTNGGYVFVYKESLPLIAWVMEYSISGTTMTLKVDSEYIPLPGYGWVPVEYVFTKSS